MILTCSKCKNRIVYDETKAKNSSKNIIAYICKNCKKKNFASLNKPTTDEASQRRKEGGVDIRCPECKAGLKLKSDLLLKRHKFLKCPKCQNTFPIPKINKSSHLIPLDTHVANPTEPNRWGEADFGGAKTGNRDAINSDMPMDMQGSNAKTSQADMPNNGLDGTPTDIGKIGELQEGGGHPVNNGQAVFGFVASGAGNSETDRKIVEENTTAGDLTDYSSQNVRDMNIRQNRFAGSKPSNPLVESDASQSFSGRKTHEVPFPLAAKSGESSETDQWTTVPVTTIPENSGLDQEIGSTNPFGADFENVQLTGSGEADAIAVSEADGAGRNLDTKNFGFNPNSGFQPSVASILHKEVKPEDTDMPTPQMGSMDITATDQTDGGWTMEAGNAPPMGQTLEAANRSVFQETVPTSESWEGISDNAPTENKGAHSAARKGFSAQSRTESTPNALTDAKSPKSGTAKPSDPTDKKPGTKTQKSLTDLEKEYMEAISFEGKPDTVKGGYTDGVVPNQRKERIFMQPSEVKTKYYFNKIKKSFTEQEFEKKFVKDEFDAMLEAEIDSPSTSEKSNLLNAYEESELTATIDEKSMSKHKALRKYLIGFLLLLLLMFLLLHFFSSS